MEWKVNNLRRSAAASPVVSRLAGSCCHTSRAGPRPPSDTCSCTTATFQLSPARRRGRLQSEGLARSFETAPQTGVNGANVRVLKRRFLKASVLLIFMGVASASCEESRGSLVVTGDF